jgi:hypothetical protein
MYKQDEESSVIKKEVGECKIFKFNFKFLRRIRILKTLMKILINSLKKLILNF